MYTHIHIHVYVCTCSPNVVRMIYYLLFIACGLMYQLYVFVVAYSYCLARRGYKTIRISNHEDIQLIHKTTNNKPIINN